jgi:hypothetical protein
VHAPPWFVVAAGQVPSGTQIMESGAVLTVPSGHARQSLSAVEVAVAAT